MSSNGSEPAGLWTVRCAIHRAVRRTLSGIALCLGRSLHHASGGRAVGCDTGQFL